MLFESSPMRNASHPRTWMNLVLAMSLGFLTLVLVACDDKEQGNQSRQQPPAAQHVEEPTSEAGLPNRQDGQRQHGIWPQVWSQHSPSVKSWEYKVNCGEASSHLDPCFLSDLSSVVVTTPEGQEIELEKDFNTNDFSGEVTRCWVLYGPEDGELPVQGEYVFRYFTGSELSYEQAVQYDSGIISYPTNVSWVRDGNDIVVDWNPPSEAETGMHYKALIWQVDDTPEMFISDVFEWDASTARLKDVPMIDGGKYSLNVAIFFDDGYAYSDYVIFEWPSLN
jgi:hypothetical protein